MKARFGLEARRLRHAAVSERNDRILALSASGEQVEAIGAAVGRSANYVRRVAGGSKGAVAVRKVSLRACREAAWHFDEPSVAKGAFGVMPDELSIQADIVRDLPLLVPCMIAAVPNGTFTESQAARARAKREGVATGYPDLIIDGIGPNAGRVCRAEIKAAAAVTADQFTKLNALHAAGHLCGVFRSLPTLVEFLAAHGWVSRGRMG
jgi:hypothetical protein